MEGKILQALENLNQKNERSFSMLDERINRSIDRIDVLSSQVQENTLILKSLEHLAQVNKAEHDRMAIGIAELSNDVKSMRKDVANVEQITASNWSEIAKPKSVK